MYGREVRVLLRHYLEEGWTKAALAKRFGVSRRTIHRWVMSGQLDRDLDAEEVEYGPRAPVPTKLDPYKELIRTRLEDYPELTAVRLLEEIRAAGYPGGYTQPKEYVRKPPEDPVVRFETPPVDQGQVDFDHVRFPWGVRCAFVAVLGYSRFLSVRFYQRQDMRTLMEGLEEAFRAFGGVPREVLFDQMRSVLTDLPGPLQTVVDTRPRAHAQRSGAEPYGSAAPERVSERTALRSRSDSANSLAGS